MIKYYTTEQLKDPTKFFQDDEDEMYCTKDELREIRKKVRALRQQMKHSLVTEGKPNCFVD